MDIRESGKKLAVEIWNDPVRRACAVAVIGLGAMVLDLEGGNPTVVCGGIRLAIFLAAAGVIRGSIREARKKHLM